MQYECPHPGCDRLFHTKKQLSSHASRCTHHPRFKNLKRFPCHSCAIGFHSKSKFKEHCLSISHIKACGRENSVSPEQLRPFQCRFCHRRFTRKSNQNRHQKVCAANAQLRSHVGSHGKTIRNIDKWSEIVECPYADCAKRMQYRNLKRHIDSVHKKLNFRCAFCRKVLRSSRSFEKHKFSCHQMEQVHEFDTLPTLYAAAENEGTPVPNPWLVDGGGSQET